MDGDRIPDGGRGRRLWRKWIDDRRHAGAAPTAAAVARRRLSIKRNANLRRNSSAHSWVGVPVSDDFRESQ